MRVVRVVVGQTVGGHHPGGTLVHGHPVVYAGVGGGDAV